MRKNIKDALYKYSPLFYHLIYKILQNFRGLVNKIDSEYFHIHLDRKTKGASITPKETGSIISFVNDNYFTFHLRPKKASDVYSKTTEIHNDFAVVIQGPIGDYCDFLVESVELYKQIFPSAYIIISTWNDEDGNIINTIKKLGVVVLLNDLPSKNGYGNINLQLVSAYNGIKYANDHNIKYCIKTRPDCRMYRSNIASYLIGLLDVFELNDKAKALGRIIATSVNTCKFKIYGITDILLFGYTVDLMKYFDLQDFEEGLLEYRFGNYPAIINGTPVVAETFLCARYLKKLGIELDWTLEHWWRCLKKYFCVIDADSIDLFWYKTDWKFEKRFYRSYASKSHRAVEFSDWLSLYSSKEISWDKIDYQEKWVIDHNKSGNDTFQKISIF